MSLVSPESGFPVRQTGQNGTKERKEDRAKSGSPGKRANVTSSPARVALARPSLEIDP